MPRLFDGFLRIKTGDKRARELFTQRFSKRGWPFPVVRDFNLVFVPRYFFEYSVVLEGGEGSKKFVSDFSVGKGSFDPVSKSLSSEAIHESELLTEFEERFEERAETKVVRSEITQNEAKRIVSILISKEKKVPRDSIEFLHFRRYYVPFWDFQLESENKSFEVRVNAFSGELIELTPIPIMRKPWVNVFHETVSDLKKPRNWVSYFAELFYFIFRGFKAVFAHFHVKSLFLFFLKNKSAQLVLLIFVLIILLFFALS